jgi:NAD(P)-dependent dehydrogenase (short-subunit alcohol dehydrogenase family)
VALVTGGNRGLGLQIVRQLAKEGLTVVLTARDPDKGVEALELLKAEGLHTVVFHQLDVTNSVSVEELANWLRKEFGGLDILVCIS